MMALERMMRGFAAGEEDTPKRATGASSRIRPMQGSAVLRGRVFEFPMWQQDSRGSHKSEPEADPDYRDYMRPAGAVTPQASVSKRKGDGELENEARQLRSRKVCTFPSFTYA